MLYMNKKLYIFHGLFHRSLFHRKINDMNQNFRETLKKDTDPN